MVIVVRLKRQLNRKTAISRTVEVVVHGEVIKTEADGEASNKGVFNSHNRLLGVDSLHNSNRHSNGDNSLHLELTHNNHINSNRIRVTSKRLNSNLLQQAMTKQPMPNNRSSHQFNMLSSLQLKLLTSNQPLLLLQVTHHSSRLMPVISSLSLNSRRMLLLQLLDSLLLLAMRRSHLRLIQLKQVMQHLIRQAGMLPRRRRQLRLCRKLILLEHNGEQLLTLSDQLDLMGVVMVQVALVIVDNRWVCKSKLLIWAVVKLLLLLIDDVNYILL